MPKEYKRLKSDTNSSARAEQLKNAYAKNIHVRRINYLMQAAKIFQTTTPSVSRRYIRDLIEIANKHTIRLDTTLKREFCKGCYTPLVPGDTAIIRPEGQHQKSQHDANPQGMPGDPTFETLEEINESQYAWMRVTCRVCSRTRRRPITPKQPQVD